MHLSLGLGLPPGNVRPHLPGASLDFNFAAGSYFGSGLVAVSLTRASTGLAQDNAGVWYSFGSGIKRITNKGFLIEEARTNKCTNYNANPTDLTNVAGAGSATVSLVDDNTALAAAGLTEIGNGKAFKIDDSASASVGGADISGTTGNTNAHTLSSYVRVTAGSAQVSWNNNTGTSSSTSSSSYTRLISANQTPPSSSSNLRILVAAHAVAYFILSDLEEGAFVTSPIIVAGSSATRAADVASATAGFAAAFTNAHSLYAQTSGMAKEGASMNNEIISDAAGGVRPAVFVSDNSTIRINDGTNSADGVFGSGDVSGTVKIATAWDGSSITAVANGGTKATHAGSLTISGTQYIGNRSAGDRALNGYLQRLALSQTKGAFDSMTA